jgi:hypothetical protein
MRHVITLSTIPPRFAEIGPTLASLVTQRSRPEAVELHIPASYRRFPGWGGALPEVPDGVTIVRGDQDFGPATKILPAVRRYRGQRVELLYVDDDHVYAPDWAERFLRARAARPEAAVCAAATTLERMGRPWAAPRPEPQAVVAPGYLHQPAFLARRAVMAAVSGGRAKIVTMPPFRKLDRSGYTDIAEGYAGVALRPEFLGEAAFGIPPVLWAVDDVWLSGHLAAAGVPIWADKGLNRARAQHRVSRTEPLYAAVIEGAGRREANQACIDHMRAAYGIWGGAATQST